MTKWRAVLEVSIYSYSLNRSTIDLHRRYKYVHVSNPNMNKVSENVTQRVNQAFPFEEDAHWLIRLPGRPM